MVTRWCVVGLFATALGSTIDASVETRFGKILGKRVRADSTLNSPIKQDVDVYLGIPFAHPPVGALRFRPPQSITEAWKEPLAARTQPPKCASRNGGQEDCLYLNVFSPATSSPEPRAVMIWIYGGGFTSGSVRNYDASALAAAEDVIVVMGNYRLGFLGFMSSEWSLEESGTTGNWGLLDQRMVMQWVQANIASFGGDASRVTIFGESAGAFSVISHLVSEGSWGLFSGAIIQSGTTHVDIFYQQLEDAKKFNEWFASTHLNCAGGLNDVECLRSVPASRFAVKRSERDGWGAPNWGVSVFPLFSSAPVIDGVVLKDSPINLLKKGLIAPGLKSLVVGTTKDEGSVFTTQLVNIVRPRISFPPTKDEMVRTLNYILQNETAVDELVAQELPKYVQAFSTEQPARKNEFREDDFRFISSMIRNFMFACPAVSLAELTASIGIPTFVYDFGFNFWPEETRFFPIGKLLGSLGNMTVDDLGAFHSSDVPFVMKLFFNRNITVNDISAETPFALYMAPAFTAPGDVKHDVSDKMSCLWANTAKCGSPSCSDACQVSWPSYTAESKNFIDFGSDGSVTIKSVSATGDHLVGEPFPSIQTCTKYMHLQAPFRDLRADLNLTGPPLARVRLQESAAQSAMWSSAILLLVMVTHTLLDLI